MWACPKNFCCPGRSTLTGIILFVSLHVWHRWLHSQIIMSNFPSFCLDVWGKPYHINNAPDLSVSKSNWKASCQLLGHNSFEAGWENILSSRYVEISILCTTPKMFSHILAVMWYIVANATTKQMPCYILTSAVLVSHELFCDWWKLPRWKHLPHCFSLLRVC